MRYRITRVLCTVGFCTSLCIAHAQHEWLPTTLFDLQALPNNSIESIKVNGSILSTDSLQVILHGRNILDRIQELGGTVSFADLGNLQKINQRLELVDSAVKKFHAQVSEIRGTEVSSFQDAVSDLENALNESPPAELWLASRALAQQDPRVQVADNLNKVQNLADRLSEKMQADAQEIRSSLDQSTAQIEVTLTVLRDPTRKVDVDPLRVLGNSDSGELEDLRSSAEQTLQQLNTARVDLKNIGETFSKKLEEFIAGFEAQQVDISNLKKAMDQLLKDMKETKSALANQGTLQFFLRSSISAYTTLVKDSLAVEKELNNLGGSAPEAIKNLLKSVKDEVEKMPAIGAIATLVEALTIRVQEIVRITKTAFITNGDSTVTFQNQGGAFTPNEPNETPVLLQSEDDIVIELSFKNQEAKPVHLATNRVVSFKGQQYFGSETLPLGVIYNRTTKVTAGAGQFATYHLGGRGGNATLKRNIGLSVGVGIASGDGAGGTVMLGLSLLRDRIHIGYGRDYGSNRNYYFVGIRGFKL